MWKHEENLEVEEKSYLIQCYERYSSLKELYETIQLFRKAGQSKNIQSFLEWIRNQLSSKKSPFYYYAFRLRSDIQAVKSALVSPYSNGLLEG